MSHISIPKIVILSLLVPFCIFLLSLLSSGEREIEALETIYGIPYPIIQSNTIIEEEMAHADINLHESVLAKQLHLLISFDPGNTSSIDVGIRENDFWLSYETIPLYRKGVNPVGIQTKEIDILLSDTFQETDRSLDMMLFSKSASAPIWSIHGLRATVEPVMPSRPELVAYIRSILQRERAL